MTNEERTIDLTNPLNTTGVNAPSKRFSVQSIYDYFWTSGQSLFRVLKKMTTDDLIRLEFYRSDVITLSSGIGSLAVTFDTIFDDAKCIITSGSVQVGARRYTPQEVSMYSTTTGKRKSPTLEAPRFEVKTITGVRKVTVYPLSGITSIELWGLAVVERMVLSNVNFDIWNANLSDMLVQGAVIMAKGDGNQTDLVQYFAQELNVKSLLYQRKPMNQNNSLIEEVK